MQFELKQTVESETKIDSALMLETFSLYGAIVMSGLTKKKVILT